MPQDDTDDEGRKLRPCLKDRLAAVSDQLIDELELELEAGGIGKIDETKLVALQRVLRAMALCPPDPVKPGALPGEPLTAEELRMLKAWVAEMPDP